MKQPAKIASQNVNRLTRPIDVSFVQYDNLLKGSTQIILFCILLVLFYFGMLGFVWTIPFPRLDFLHNYNGYFNWASFIIAGLMFHWYRQSALLSYFLLILLFGISYGVTLVEASHQPQEISTCIIYASMLFTGLFGVVKMLTKRNLNFFRGLLIIPLWLVRFIVKPISAKY